MGKSRILLTTTNKITEHSNSVTSPKLEPNFNFEASMKLAPCKKNCLTDLRSFSQQGRYVF